MKLQGQAIEILGSLILSGSQYQANSSLFLDNNKQVVLKQLPFVDPDSQSVKLVAVRGQPTRTFTVGSDEAINFVGDASNGVSQKYYRDGGAINHHMQISSATASDCPNVSAFRARGTLLEPTAVAPGDFLYAINVRGHEGVLGFQERAGIRFIVDANVTQSDISSGRVPTAIRFRTGNLNTQDRMQIDNNGNVGIGITSAITARLQVNGNAAIGYSAGVTVPSNSLAVQGGLYVGNSGSLNKVVGTRDTGWTKLGGSSRKTLATLSTSTITLQQLAEAYNAMYDALVSHGLIGT